MTRFATALVHYPCVDRHGEIFTTSITNLDVHDIARSSRTYGVDAFYVVTPVSAQREMAERIVAYWEVDGVKRNPDRRNALAIAHVVASIELAIEAETQLCGKRPLVVVTSAKPQGSVSFADVRARVESHDVLLLFGTGHGLAKSVVDGADVVLAPIVGRAPDYNHLSVRSAAAIVLDRLLAPSP
jgi:hypothetical protein